VALISARVGVSFSLTTVLLACWLTGLLFCWLVGLLGFFA